ncbi:MAG: transporter [Epulopiscium sp. Nele67-Bin002]|nr:MAG: transporter [Epulopiscium sp. Nuni2H_MBin001]OON92303.1 MAG: transporter [Epulopiscium sp. Nele67-Bin002]
MLRDITIGQYYPVKSCIHSLDPRTKIILVFMYIVAIFLIDTFVGYGVIVGVLAVVIKLSKVPLKFILKGLKSIVFILAFTMALNMFLVNGETVIFRFWIFTLSVEGIILAVKMGIRLILLIVGSSLLTLTTSPIRLTDGIESLLNPLKVIKVPAHEIAMMMSIALRFIPILLEETDKIMKAQTARGADFETGSIVKRAKAMVPILIPLFVSAFMRAEDLAMAMEARCYRGGEGRTKLNNLKFHQADFIALALGVIFIGLCVYT